MCSCRKMSQMSESSLILPGYHRILLMIYSCIVCQAVYAEWDYWGHDNYNPLYSVVGMILCIISKLGLGTNVMKASCVVCYIIIYTSDWRVSASSMSLISYGHLTRYIKLQVAHAPGMPGKFLRHRLQRKPLVSDPDMHHCTCVMHVPWCMSGSLTRGGEENVPGIPGACAIHNFTYLARGPCFDLVWLHQVLVNSCNVHNSDSTSGWSNVGPTSGWQYRSLSNIGLSPIAALVTYSVQGAVDIPLRLIKSNSNQYCILLHLTHVWLTKQGKQKIRCSWKDIVLPQHICRNMDSRNQ